MIIERVLQKVRFTTRLVLVVGVLGVLVASAAIAASDENKSNKHALMVDIHNYSHLKSRPVNPDMMDLFKTLRSEGFNVKTVKDGSRREVNQAINEFVYRLKKDDVTIIIINAGIATSDRSDDVYILFQDTRVDDIEVDGMSLRTLDSLLDKLKPQSQLLALVLDTLGSKQHSSSSSSKGGSLGATTEELQWLIARQLSSLGKERVVLSEIDSRDEKTYESGSLTRLLARGLHGRADTNGDSVIETEELQLFVEKQSNLTPVIQGYEVNPVYQSSKLIRTTPIQTQGNIVTQSMQIATRSIKGVVLNDDTLARHKSVLADWVVDGLLGRAENIRLYTLMSKIKGKTKDQIPQNCFSYYKTLEPNLEQAYLLQKDINRSQLKNLVAAEVVKKKVAGIPKTCISK